MGSTPLVTPDDDEGSLVYAGQLRAEFVRLLTVDSGTDRRRKDYNQAIFDADEGFAIFTGTDLQMVMDKFDKAVSRS